MELGLKKIEKTYQEEYCTLARRLLRQWIFEDLQAGKDIVQKAYAEAVIYSIKGIRETSIRWKREKRKCITGVPVSYVAAIAIRALHFEHFGWSKEDYFLGKEDYFVDMICYHAWQTLCEEFTEVVNDDDELLYESKQSADMTDLLFYGSIEHYGAPEA